MSSKKLTHLSPLPYLRKRGDSYQYRRRVPKRFQPLIGVAEWWVVVRAATDDDAKAESVRLAKEHDALLNSFKRLPPAELLRLQVANIREKARKPSKGRRRETPNGTVRENLIAAIGTALAALSPRARAAIQSEGGIAAVLDRIDHLAFQQAAVSMLGDDKPELPADLLSRPDAEVKAEVASFQSWRDVLQTVEEDGPRLAPVAAELGLWRPQQVVTVSAAADLWLRSKPRRPITSARLKMVTRRLADHLGDMAVGKVAPTHLHSFMDAVAKLPDRTGLPNRLRTGSMRELTEWVARNPDHPVIQTSTRNQYLIDVRGLFAFCFRRELIHQNPAVKLERHKDERSRSEKRRPFTRQELRDLVDASKKKWGGGSEEHLQMLIAIYTGMRISEGAGLLRADLRKDVDAHGWFLDLKPNSHRRLKTPSAERVIPVHPDLEPLLLDHQKKVPTGGLLFPTMGLISIPRSASNLSKHFGSIMREAGIVNDKRAVWHSFRHSWEDHAAERIPDAGCLYLSGRMKQGSAGKYGRGPGLATCVRWTAVLDPLGSEPH